MGKALLELLSGSGFKFVDIGARGGAMNELGLLLPYAHYFACEPDEQEAQTLLQMLEKANCQNATIISEAIASTEGNTTLHITKQPGLSSLLLPNEAVVKRFYRGGEYDVIERVSVPAITLDHAAERYGFRDACFIKVDTQGTEADILRSGTDLLLTSILGVYVEVEFHSFYKGQPLFADVDTYLRSLGFSLFDLHRSRIRRASYQSDLYSRRQVVWAHALYLKEPEVCLELSNEIASKMLPRLLGIALAFEHYDLALEIAPLLKKEFGTQLIQDVDMFVRNRTDQILQQAKHRTPFAPLSFAQKDRKYLYH